jgi:hypothetical protein
MIAAAMIKNLRALCLGSLACVATTLHSAETTSTPAKIDIEQVSSWSQDDLKFFLHGSMSTEVFPEPVLRAFFKTYPELFPTSDFTHLGLIPDREFGWPIGISRKAEVKHLGGLSAVGINCASCHVAQITSRSSEQPIRILGVTSHFDVETFFNSILLATFKTSEPANMKKFLEAYLSENHQVLKEPFDQLWAQHEKQIIVMLQSDPFGAEGVQPGELHKLADSDVSISADHDLTRLVHAMVKLFHNIRAALHVPDKPPEKIPPASGPGRNDAFGILAAGLLNSPTPYAPIKYGLVWNVGKRTWVHWDGNTKSPISRNLLASLGLGAPLYGKRADFVFADVKHQTDLSEKIAPPKYPFRIDNQAAKHGEPLFAKNCNVCHGGPESDKRLFAVADVGTDPKRAEMFTEKVAGGFNKFLNELEAEGYQPPKEFGVRSTEKYWAATLSGVWARSPYHGSVRTMRELLTAPAERAKSFHRGSRAFDENEMGYTDEGAYLLETSASGNLNSGHDYGTKLTAQQKRDLIEYLKTL